MDKTSFLSIPSAFQELEKESETVKVSNLPLTANASYIQKFFENCGKIESIKYRSPKSDSQVISKKAFVKFCSQDAASKALDLNGTIYEDRHIQITKLFPSEDYECSILVSNLTNKVTEEKLWNLFSQFGQVKYVDLTFHPKAKWFATITFHTKEARRLSTKSHLQLDGEVLKIIRKISPEKREAKLLEKYRKMQEEKQKLAEMNAVNSQDEDEFELNPIGNPDVDFKNIRSYSSKKKQKRIMEEKMGLKKAKLTKELGCVASEAKALKKKKKADREKTEKENKDRVKRIKIKIKKI